MVKILSYLLPLTLGALIAWALIPHGDGTKLLEAQKKHHLHEIDSLQRIQSDLAERYSLASRVHAQDSIALVRAHEETNKWHQQYVIIKNTPLVHYTESELDSVVSAIVGQH
jgi:hypothetical protein